MKTKLSICTIIFMLFITACAANPPQPTSTPVDIEAIKTDVVATTLANITEIAAAFTPTPEATATLEIVATPTIGVIESPTVTVTPTENDCDKMIFVSDTTIPDNYEVSPGQEFIKTWKVKNIGACSWKTNYQVIYGWGDPEGKMGGQDTAITAEVLPDTEGEVSVKLKAPTPLGTYHGYWRLANNNGYPFGTVLSVVIVVK